MTREFCVCKYYNTHITAAIMGVGKEMVTADSSQLLLVASLDVMELENRCIVYRGEEQHQ
jgi:hypothetical protein